MTQQPRQSAPDDKSRSAIQTQLTESFTKLFPGAVASHADVRKGMAAGGIDFEEYQLTGYSTLKKRVLELFREDPSNADLREALIQDGDEVAANRGAINYFEADIATREHRLELAQANLNGAQGIDAAARDRMQLNFNTKREGLARSKAGLAALKQEIVDQHVERMARDNVWASVHFLQAYARATGCGLKINVVAINRGDRTVYLSGAEVAPASSEHPTIVIENSHVYRTGADGVPRVSSHFEFTGIEINGQLAPNGKADCPTRADGNCAWYALLLAQEKILQLYDTPAQQQSVSVQPQPAVRLPDSKKPSFEPITAREALLNDSIKHISTLITELVLVGVAASTLSEKVMYKFNLLQDQDNPNQTKIATERDFARARASITQFTVGAALYALATQELHKHPTPSAEDLAGIRGGVENIIKNLQRKGGEISAEDIAAAKGAILAVIINTAKPSPSIAPKTQVVPPPLAPTSSAAPKLAPVANPASTEIKQVAKSPATYVQVREQLHPARAKAMDILLKNVGRIHDSLAADFTNLKARKGDELRLNASASGMAMAPELYSLILGEQIKPAQDALSAKGLTSLQALLQKTGFKAGTPEYLQAFRSGMAAINAALEVPEPNKNANAQTSPLKSQPEAVVVQLPAQESKPQTSRSSAAPSFIAPPQQSPPEAQAAKQRAARQASAEIAATVDFDPAELKTAVAASLQSEKERQQRALGQQLQKLRTELNLTDEEMGVISKDALAEINEGFSKRVQESVLVEEDGNEIGFRPR